MKIIKRLFCKHDYTPIAGNYLLIGWDRCKKCGKETYTGDEVGFTKLPKITISINQKEAKND